MRQLFCFEISLRITNATLALSHSLLINVKMIGDNRPPKYNKTVITKFNVVQLSETVQKWESAAAN